MIGAELQVMRKVEPLPLIFQECLQALFWDHSPDYGFQVLDLGRPYGTAFS